MADDDQNTPDVIQEMRKPEGIDMDSKSGKPVDGTFVKSSEPYLFLDQKLRKRQGWH